MVLKIIGHITEDNMKFLNLSDEKEITMDLQSVSYLTSMEINQILFLSNIGKIIKLMNANEHIRETIRLLDLDTIIEIIAS